MSDAAAPTPGHELLLGLAGWVDDDLLAIGRELVAVGEEAGALELLVASLAADRTGLPHPVRTRLAEAVERRVGGGFAQLLPPGAPLPDRTAHAFAPDAGDPDATARINEVVAGLTAVTRSGARTSVTWRLTPAGAAPGPLPHPVVLLVLDDPAPAEVLAYQVGAALARAGVTASVEAFVDGAALPPYQRAALAAAGTPVRTERPGAAPDRSDAAVADPDARVTAGDLPSVATPTSATVTGPHKPDPLNDPLETTSGSAAAAPGAGVTGGAVPDDPSWSGPYAAVPTVGARRSADLGRSRDGDRRDASGTPTGRAGDDGPDPAAVIGSAGPGADRADDGPLRSGASSVEDAGSTPSTGRAGSAISGDAAGPGSSAEVGGSSSPPGDTASSTTGEGTGSTPPVEDPRSASPAEHTGSASPDTSGEARPVQTTGSTSPAQGTGVDSSVEDTRSPSPAPHTGADPPGRSTGSPPPAGSTGAASPVESNGSASPLDGTGTAAPERAGSAPGPDDDPGPAGTGGATPVPQPPTAGAAGVDPARFDPARNAVDRTVHGGSAVTGRPTGAPANGRTAPGSASDVRTGAANGGAAPDVRPGPDPDAYAGGNGHPSPRPAPRRLPRPAPQDGPRDPAPGDQPVNGHPSPERAPGSEREWARQWSNGSWSMPAEGVPGRDPDIEPTTSPTPTTPPLSRVPPSPTRRSGEAAEAFDPDPDGSRDTLSSEPRRRHRLDDLVETGDAEEHAPPDVLDSRLTPNEQELLRRLQQELAARERGSADQPSSPRNGTPHPPEQD